ncbi:MAG: type II secretion system protein [Acholeplasmataceae bacterium]|nr:type II secretion system protein [Acholeplasmataceae bacterium]
MLKQIISHKISLYRSSKGFTLIELVAVMAIVGVLAVALLPSIEAAMNRSENTRIITTLTKIDGAIKVYQLEHDGNLPTDLTVLKKARYLEKDTYNGIEYKKGATDNDYTLLGKNSNGDTITADGKITIE